MTDTRDVLTRAQEALEGITRGPWKLGNRAYPDVVHTPSGCLWNPSRGEINNAADGAFIAAARTLVPELVDELENLHTWDGLISLLDEHWPESIFPTAADREDRDLGPRIISLIRQTETLTDALTQSRAEVAALRAKPMEHLR